VQRAIDVPAVVEAAYFGAAEPATGLVAPGILGHREHRLVEKRDVQAAKKLLAEAGLPDGFEATLSVLNESDQMSAAQVVQANLAEVGIKTEIIPYDSGAFWSLGSEADGDKWKDLQIYLQKWGLPPDPGAMAQWHLPNQIGIWNWERWNSPEFADLYTQGLSELDEAKRAAIYVKMQDLMEESGAYTFLTNGVQALLYRDFIEPGTTPDQRQVMIPQFRYLGS
jgi:peptide/nickel transport system substrate-binding protein